MEILLLPVGLRIKHRFYPQLTGTIAGVLEDEGNRPYRIEWDESWLAATLIDNPFRMTFLSENEVEVLERKQQPLLKNRDCEQCSGKGFKRNQLCHGCNGTGKVRFY